MKTQLLLLLLIGMSGLAQVGINTTSPTATLDVNGSSRIRVSNPNARPAAAKDSILVQDANGNVLRTTSRLVVTSHLKSFVKGGFASTGNQNLTLTGGVLTIPFNFKEFDTNGDYSVSSHTFTAPAAGIYSISAQVKAVAGLSVASNFGIAILKNGVVVARSGFGNLSVAGVTVSPPIRSINTLVKLAAEDTITFQLFSDLVSAGILGTREDSFFWIAQEQ